MGHIKKPPSKDLVDISLRIPRGALKTILAAGSLDTQTFAKESKVAFANYLINRHRRREITLGEIRLTEPCLNILLDLYASHQQKRLVDMTSLSVSSGAPFSSGLRYVERLVAMGIAEKSDDPSDGRRSFISLSESYVAKVDSWMEVEIQCVICEVIKTILLLQECV